MNTWLLIFSLTLIIFYLDKIYRQVNEHNNHLRQTYIGIHESHAKAMELLSVSTIAGSIVSRALFDNSLTEQLHKAEAERLHIIFAPFTSSGDNKISRDEAEEIVKNLDETIDRLSVFKFIGREKYIALSWNIYDDVKNYKNKT